MYSNKNYIVPYLREIYICHPIKYIRGVQEKMYVCAGKVYIFRKEFLANVQAPRAFHQKYDILSFKAHKWEGGVTCICS